MTDDQWFSGATVLVVDDHEPNLVLIERMLHLAGLANVHTVGNSADVVRFYQQLEPDIVLLDLHMPGMDGVEVMAALRDATPSEQFVPIVVLTADATDGARDRVLEAGANDFLTKPVDRAEVVLRVRNLLRTRMLHGRLHAHNVALRSEIDERRAAEERTRAVIAEKRRRVTGAIESGAIRMVFQPVARLGDGGVVGYEALARFDTEPRRPPDVWFDEAASVGLGIELELAAAAGALERLGAIPSGAFMSLNLSPTAVTSAALHQLLARHPADRLVLEITEHAPVDDYEALLSRLAGLRDAGVRVAVDDAGAGFASLRHILRIQPDIIKLDTGLVRSIDADPVKRALASSLVTFAREIGAEIVAEGVETAEERDALGHLGVALGQGYHLGRPAEAPTGDAAGSTSVGRRGADPRHRRRR